MNDIQPHRLGSLTPAQGAVVVTPSHAPDLELLVDLHDSVRRFGPDGIRHLVIVPPRDVRLFRSRLGGGTAEIVAEGDLLPHAMRHLPLVDAYLNVRAPWPPIRGWILQQLVKLSVAGHIESDVLLLVDSDVTFVRPFSMDTFVHEGIVRLYCAPDEIDDSLPDHVVWHRVARSALGLPPFTSLPLPDYVSSLNAWDRRLVMQMRSRIEEVTSRPWSHSLGRQLHFSEFTLYGVFVDSLAAGQHPHQSPHSLCHCYWKSEPLSLTQGSEFVADLPDSDVAVMISSKSRTPLDIRRRVLGLL